jgi:ABC-type polysaccharide/polyol phosphate transport system ATPase subunit
MERFCDRCLLVQSGAVQALGSPHEVADLYRERVLV